MYASKKILKRFVLFAAAAAFTVCSSTLSAYPITKVDEIPRQRLLPSMYMIRNGADPGEPGAVNGQWGFNTSQAPDPVEVPNAYSVDYYRDIKIPGGWIGGTDFNPLVIPTPPGNQSVLNLPGGMQATQPDALYFMVADEGGLPADAAGTRLSHTGLVNRWIEFGSVAGNIGRLYEIRFVGLGNGGLGYFGFGGPYERTDFGLEFWDLGNSPGPEDDVRGVPAAFDPDGVYTWALREDHQADPDENDRRSPWTYYYTPKLIVPGDPEAGYNEWLAAPNNQEDLAATLLDPNNGRPVSRVHFIKKDDDSAEELPGPETGSVFRIQFLGKRVQAMFSPNTGGVIPCDTLDEQEIEIAFLGEPGFDPTMLLLSSVETGRGGIAKGMGPARDVNSDGILDGIYLFDSLDLSIVCGDTEIVIIGMIGDDSETAFPYVATAALETSGDSLVCPALPYGSNQHKANNINLTVGSFGAGGGELVENGIPTEGLWKCTDYFEQFNLRLIGLVETDTPGEYVRAKADTVPLESLGDFNNDGQGIFNSTIASDRAAWPAEFSSGGNPIIYPGAENIVTTIVNNLTQKQFFFGVPLFTYETLGVVVHQRSLAYNKDGLKTLPKSAKRYHRAVSDAIFFEWEIVNPTDKDIKDLTLNFSPTPSVGNFRDDRAYLADDMPIYWDADFKEEGQKHPGMVGAYIIEAPGEVGGIVAAGAFEEGVDPEFETDPLPFECSTPFAFLDFENGFPNFPFSVEVEDYPNLEEQVWNFDHGGLTRFGPEPNFFDDPVPYLPQCSDILKYDRETGYGIAASVRGLNIPPGESVKVAAVVFLTKTNPGQPLMLRNGELDRRNKNLKRHLQRKEQLIDFYHRFVPKD